MSLLISHKLKCLMGWHSKGRFFSNECRVYVRITPSASTFSLGVVRPASQWPPTYRRVPLLLWTRSSLRTTEKGRNRTTFPVAPAQTTKFAPTDTPTSAHLFPLGERETDKQTCLRVWMQSGTLVGTGIKVWLCYQQWTLTLYWQKNWQKMYYTLLKLPHWTLWSFILCKILRHQNNLIISGFFLHYSWNIHFLGTGAEVLSSRP